MSVKIPSKDYDTMTTAKSLPFRVLAYLLCVLTLINPVAPSVAAILDGGVIEEDFLTDPFYIENLSSDYQFKTPEFVEWTESGTSSLETLYEKLLRDNPQSIGEPNFIPIGVGGISVIIPTYDRYNYIGTPAAQARYVQTQIRALLGRSLINADEAEYSNSTIQLNTLYENAVKYALNNDVRYGEQLNLDQGNSNLTDGNGQPINMIWPELHKINNQDVIVPVVYLTSETVRERKVAGHQTELPQNASFASLTIKNANVSAARSSFLELVGDLRLSNASLTGDEALEITAGGAFDNASSIVSANNDLIIGAKSIENRRIVYRYDLGNEQGTRYGEISRIGSNKGDVILRSHSDIEFSGSGLDASNGAVTLAANGNIVIGTSRVFDSVTSRYGSGFQTRSQVSYLQSHITAEETIKMLAGGQIVLDAAEIVSDRGHIELLATMGISVVDAIGQIQSQASGKFGKKKVTESVYQTTSIRALLDAGKGVKLSTDFGDITLRAADITSADGTSVSAKNGAVNLLMTTETDHYSYSSVKKGTFTTKTVSKGKNIETGIPNSIVGGFAVEALAGVTVEYEGDPDLSTDQQLDVIANMPGMSWIDDVRNSPDVNWNEILLAHEEWYDKNRSLSPAFAAVVAIAVAVATGGAGAAAAGALGASGTTAAVISAGVSSFISQASMAAINGAVNGDIGGAMEDFASSDTLKSLAVSMVTAGAIAQVDAAFFNVDSASAAEAAEAVETASTAAQAQAGVDAAINTAGAMSSGMSLTAQVGQAVTHAAVRSGISTLAYGGSFDDFGESFAKGLAQQGINGLGKSLANKIGQFHKDANVNGELDVIDVSRYIAHAATGCLAGALSAGVNDGDSESGCAAGAGGAIVGEAIADLHKEATDIEVKQEDLNEEGEKLQAWLAKKLGMDPSEFSAEDIEALALGDFSPDELMQLEGFRRMHLELESLKSQGVDLARLGAGLAAFAGGGTAEAVNIAADTGENAAKNNAFWFLVIPAVKIGLAAYSVYSLHQSLIEAKKLIDEFNDPLTSDARKRELAEEIALTLGSELVLSAIPGGKVAKGVAKRIKETGVVSDESIERMRALARQVEDKLTDRRKLPDTYKRGSGNVVYGPNGGKAFDQNLTTQSGDPIFKRESGGYYAVDSEGRQYTVSSPSSPGVTRLSDNVWSEDPKIRGRQIENELEKTEYKDWGRTDKYEILDPETGVWKQTKADNFPLVDFHLDNTVVSLKTVDTWTTSWERDMKDHMRKLSSRPIATGDNLDVQPTKVLDIRIQPGGYDDTESLREWAVEQYPDIHLVIKEFDPLNR